MCHLIGITVFAGTCVVQGNLIEKGEISSLHSQRPWSSENQRFSGVRMTILIAGFGHILQ
jgi:hypothetical protein